MFRRFRARLWPCAVAACLAAPTQALTLPQAFDAAWQRQPEAASQGARRDAAEAARRAASSWTAAPPTLELLSKSDRRSSNTGQREIDAGLAVPLWLPGERGRSVQLADAELKAGSLKVIAAKLKLAATVRENWWAFHRATLEHEVARDRLHNARQLAGDVNKRAHAGDLSKADQFQADSAVAQAEAAMAEATAAQRSAQLALRALLGSAELPSADAEPVPTDAADLHSSHPALAELAARIEVSRKAAELASVQKRANPELLVATTRERGQFGDAYRQSVTVGVRFPFGGGSRSDAKLALARAEALEAESLAALERARLLGDIEAAQLRLESSRLQLEAADKRARLAREVRGFFEKSFRLGQTDLPIRLRVELEAVEAERQAARTRIDVAAAISALRQALGQLPE